MRTWGVHHAGIASNLGDWRRVAVGLCVLALACGRAESSQSSSLLAAAGPSGEDEPAASGPSELSTGDDDSNDAGAPLASGDSAQCPAPRPGVTLGNAARWAREPGTGNCCRYANPTAAPTGWLLFDYEAACKTACLCSALEGFEGDFEDLIPVRDSLECRCSLASCPSTLQEAEQSLCAETWPLGAVQRLVGCGMVVVIDRNGFSGYAWVFEQPSGSGPPPASGLVGALQFSDEQSFDPCPTSSWSAGRDFFAECDAAEVVTCQLCGDSPGPEYPPCQ